MARRRWNVMRISLRESVRTLSQTLMEMEVEEHIGATCHQRTPERMGVRNGYRDRASGTRGWALV